MQENSAGASESGGAGLASLLLNTYQEQLIQTRLQEEQEKEEGALEEEDDDEEEESDGKRGWQAGRRSATFLPVRPSAQFCHSPRIPGFPATDDLKQQQQDEKPTAEEKALLREEFISQMHQRFLDGKDKDFDYRWNIFNFLGLYKRVLCWIEQLPVSQEEILFTGSL